MSALSNSFSMIESICRSGPKGMSFTDVVRQTGVSKASAHRLLHELLSLGALEFDPEKKRYSGGLLLARLGGSIISNYDLRERARPALEQLHEHTGQVVTLGVLGDGTGVYIDKIESPDFGIRLHSEIGKTFPLHCTAMGKVLLAFSSPDILRRLGETTLKAYTTASITDLKALKENLATTRKLGYGTDHEEITRGLVCIAAPIFGPGDELVGAMSCTSPLHIAQSSQFDHIKAAVVASAQVASGSYPNPPLGE